MKQIHLPRRTILGGGLAALLVGGLLFGTTHASSSTAGPAASPTPQEQRGQRFERFLSALANNLHIDASTLRSALVKTEQDLVDEAVQQGRLNADQAARIKEGIAQRGGRLGIRGPLTERKPLHQAKRQGWLQGAATALGITPAELRQRLHAGTSLNQLAQELGKDPAAVKQAILQRIEARVDDAVKQGRLSAQRAQALKQRLPERLDRLMDRTFGSGREGRRTSASP